MSQERPVEEVLADLEAERRRAADRRDRFDAEFDRLEAEIARSQRVSRERKEALSSARAQLARPLVRAAVRGTRVIDRMGRAIHRARGLLSGDSTATQPSADPTVVVPTAAAVDLAPHGQVDLAPAIAIHIAPTSWEVAATWGDTHFAGSLQRAFERQGWRATVHVATEADAEPAVRADVALHLFGLSAPPVRPGQRSILWIVSHPDRMRASLARQYDLVFVASDPFAADLARLIDRPVRALHQATDPTRFFPDPVGPNHQLLFVGNSRKRRRPILDALAGTDLELAVYGGDWSPELLNGTYLRGTWIPNEDLHRYYSSADIVLNDHWADMRQEGFVSNRVYDALASGGFVISDDVPGMGERFDDSVATFATRDQLMAIVSYYIAHPAERHERADRGRAAVLARHTFDHRATSIIEATRALDAHDAAPAGSPDPLSAHCRTG